MSISRFSILFFLSSITLWLLSGCANVQDVNIEDRSTQQGNVSMSRKMSERWSIEASYARARGHERQTLAGPPSSSAESIELDGLTIIGPAQLKNDAELSLLKLGAGLIVLDRSRVKLKTRFGLSQNQVNVRFDAGTNVYKYSDQNVGAFGDFSVSLPLTKQLEAFATTGITVKPKDDWLTLEQQALGLRWSPATPISFNLGWYEWDYEDDRARSNISIDLQGMSLGVQLNF